MFSYCLQNYKEFLYFSHLFQFFNRLNINKYKENEILPITGLILSVKKKIPSAANKNLPMVFRQPVHANIEKATLGQFRKQPFSICPT